MAGAQSTAEMTSHLPDKTTTTKVARSFRTEPIWVSTKGIHCPCQVIVIYTLTYKWGSAIVCELVCAWEVHLLATGKVRCLRNCFAALELALITTGDGCAPGVRGKDVYVPSIISFYGRCYRLLWKHFQWQ